jgi:hypothetical protein
MKKRLQLSSRVSRLWDELDELMRTDHGISASGIIWVSKDSEVGISFHRALDSDDTKELLATIREPHLAEKQQLC